MEARRPMITTTMTISIRVKQLFMVTSRVSLIMLNGNDSACRIPILLILQLSVILLNFSIFTSDIIHFDDSQEDGNDDQQNHQCQQYDDGRFK